MSRPLWQPLRCWRSTEPARSTCWPRMVCSAQMHRVSWMSRPSMRWVLESITLVLPLLFDYIPCSHQQTDRCHQYHSTRDPEAAVPQDQDDRHLHSDRWGHSAHPQQGVYVLSVPQRNAGGLGTIPLTQPLTSHKNSVAAGSFWAGLCLFFAFRHHSKVCSNKNEWSNLTVAHF